MPVLFQALDKMYQSPEITAVKEWDICFACVVSTVSELRQRHFLPDSHCAFSCSERTSVKRHLLESRPSLFQKKGVRGTSKNKQCQ